MGALTKTCPKPMIPLNGRPMIDHALAHVSASGVRKIVVNAHYLSDQIAAHLEGTNAELSFEPGAPLETGGGLKHALPLLGAHTVATLNTDTLWLGANPIAQLSAAWQPDTMKALLLLVPKEHLHM